MRFNNPNKFKYSSSSTIKICDICSNESKRFVSNSSKSHTICSKCFDKLMKEKVSNLDLNNTSNCPYCLDDPNDPRVNSMFYHLRGPSVPYDKTEERNTFQDEKRFTKRFTKGSSILVNNGYFDCEEDKDKDASSSDDKESNLSVECVQENQEPPLISKHKPEKKSRFMFKCCIPQKISITKVIRK